MNFGGSVFKLLVVLYNGRKLYTMELHLVSGGLGLQRLEAGFQFTVRD